MLHRKASLTSKKDKRRSTKAHECKTVTLYITQIANGAQMRTYSSERAVCSPKITVYGRSIAYRSSRETTHLHTYTDDTDARRRGDGCAERGGVRFGLVRVDFAVTLALRTHVDDDFPHGLLVRRSALSEICDRAPCHTL